MSDKKEEDKKKSLIYWKKHFHKNPFFKKVADFETEDENETCSMGINTTSFCKQNPVCNGYFIVSERDDVLQSGCYESPSGCDSVDWFVDEVMKLEKNGLLF